MSSENEKLLEELEKRFEKMKKELVFESSFEDLERIFFISDAILRERFVSENLSRQVCSRIVDTYMNWNGYLHSLIMPNPQNILNMGESKLFSQEEKKEITENMKEIMKLSSENSLIGLQKDKEREGKFIDKAVRFWDESFKESLIKVMEKINKGWEEK